LRNWLENNPVGIALAAGCGVLVLVSAALAWAWSRAPSYGLPEVGENGDFGTLAQAEISELGPLGDYREFTERPVFDPSRQPAVNVDGDDLDGEPDEIAGAPEVRLTGVVITPESKFVTLKPASGADTVIAREGQSLEGEYYGWTVAGISPRSVALESRDGESLELALEVNTRRIEEPPKPPPPAAASEDEDGGTDGGRPAAAADGEEPMSRAEEIRQRIAERREELRRQAEEGEGTGKGRRRSSSAYQSAIQNMINRGRDDDEGEKDGDNGK